ncbi:MAG: glycosyltransferase family 4 protein [Geminicoccaceae bacterium]
MNGSSRRPWRSPEVAPSGLWLLLDSSGIGGIETHVLTLAQGLAAAAVPANVVFLADHGPHPLKSELARAGIPYTNVAGGLFGLARLMRRQMPSLVHTHGYKAGVLGRLAAKALRTPVVSTYHSGEPGVGRVRLYLALDRITARLGHSIAVSEQIRRRLPFGTALIDNFVAMPGPRALPANRPSTVGFVGRLSLEKGPDEFCALAERLPTIRFVIYGDGPMRAGLEAVHGARVEFRGVAAMATQWAELGLLCMPSRHEGLPMAALEALAHGIPVAAYAVGALPDVIEHGRSGWLAPPGNRHALEGAIRAWHAQDGDTAAGMARSAQALIAQRFSVAAGVDKILDVYARAASGTDMATSFRCKVPRVADAAAVSLPWHPSCHGSDKDRAGRVPDLPCNRMV